MERYSDHRPCEKCGGAASTSYDRQCDIMRRRCFRCGHVWNEAPLQRRRTRINADVLRQKLVEATR